MSYAQQLARTRPSASSVDMAALTACIEACLGE